MARASQHRALRSALPPACCTRMAPCPSSTARAVTPRTRRSAHAPAAATAPAASSRRRRRRRRSRRRGRVRRACTANRQRRRRQRVRATAGRRSGFPHSPRRAGGRERPTHLASSARCTSGRGRRERRHAIRSCRSARIEARPDQSRQTSRAPPPSAGYSPARAGPSSRRPRAQHRRVRRRSGAENVDQLRSRAVGSVAATAPRVARARRCVARA